MPSGELSDPILERKEIRCSRWRVMTVLCREGRIDMLQSQRARSGEAVCLTRSAASPTTILSTHLKAIDRLRLPKHLTRDVSQNLSVMGTWQLTVFLGPLLLVDSISHRPGAVPSVISAPSLALQRVWYSQQ